MSFELLRSGAVIRYSYLWRHESLLGESEGRKSTRPIVVGFRVKKSDGRDIIWLFPITSKKPELNRLAVEIPDNEKQRAGLDFEKRLWIILDEFNEDQVGKSYFLSPKAPIGYFSKKFILPNLLKFLAEQKNITGVKRV